MNTGDGFRGRSSDEHQYPGELLALLRQGGDAMSRAASALSGGELVNFEEVTLKPPVSRPDKIVCAGVNFRGHIAETGLREHEVPELFGRFASSLIGCGESLVRPRESEQLDF